MSARKKGLGRGLNTLIPSAPIPEKNLQNKEDNLINESKNSEMTLPIHKIEPNPDQPRNQFDVDSLQ